MEVQLKDIYVGTLIKDKDIKLEDVIKYDIPVYWKCKQRHLYKSIPDVALSVYQKELCPCCLRIKGEPQDAAAWDYENDKSLFQLDYEIFGGAIAERFIQIKDNYINQLNYNSTKRIMWNIDGKARVYSVKDMILRLTEENQQRLREIYEKSQKVENRFHVIKCQACGKYEIKYHGIKIDKVKCGFCNEYVHNPFSFGRWLEKHKEIEEKLEDYLSWEQLNKLKGLNKDDESTNIVLTCGFNIRNTSAYCITHNLIDL